MEHSSTSLLMEDMYDERTQAKLSRFASYASSTGTGVTKDPAFAGNDDKHPAVAALCITVFVDHPPPNPSHHSRVD
jgi:hypothetical protein